MLPGSSLLAFRPVRVRNRDGLQADLRRSEVGGRDTKRTQTHRLSIIIDSDSHIIALFLLACLPQSHVSCSCHTGVFVEYVSALSASKGSVLGMARGRTGKMLWWGCKWPEMVIFYVLSANIVHGLGCSLSSDDSGEW
jgi:hypothetical protein